MDWEFHGGRDAIGPTPMARNLFALTVSVDPPPPPPVKEWTYMIFYTKGYDQNGLFADNLEGFYKFMLADFGHAGSTDKINFVFQFGNQRGFAVPGGGFFPTTH